MNPTQQLHAIGQSLWLDHITRALLTSGTLRRYLADLSVTGLTSNPTIFDQAIAHTGFYDEAIRRKRGEGRSAEELFFELALEDLGQAADLFRPIHDQTQGADGWVSLEVSPLLAYDTRSTIDAARALLSHRGVDLRRDPHQRHTALLARALSGGRGRLPAGNRAPPRGWPGSAGAIGGVALHQSLGSGGAGQGTG
jgi:hypothetical protein